MSVDRNITVRDKQVTKEIHRLFWRALFQEKFYLGLMLLILPSFFLLYVFMPLQVAYALQAIFAKDFASVNHYIIVIAVAGFIQLVIHTLSIIGHNRNGVTACEYVQNEAFANYLDKDYEFYSDQYVGSLGMQAAQLRDAISTYSNLLVTQLGKSGTIVIGGMVVLLMNSLLIAAITIVCMFSVLGFTLLTSRYRIRYRREVSTAGSELAGVLGDALGHGATVKSFASEDYEQQRLKKTVRHWKKVQLKSWDSFIPANTGRNILNFITLGVLVYVTAHLYQAGTISIAIVVLVQLYMIRLIATALELADLVKAYEEMMGGAHQAMQTMLIPKKVTDPAKPKRLGKNIQRIDFLDVSFGYDRSKKGSYAVKDFSASIKAGQKIGLVGYSGSGKTTLTKLMLRFMDVSDGEIRINNINIKDMTQKELRQSIAYVPQEPLLFHRSIIENIAYGRPGASKKEILEAARLAYLDEFVSEMPDGYDTLVGERGVKLSGGQRQRVAIARAILKDAPILVLDEATSALDSRSEHLIQEALTNLMKDRTSLVIAHRLSTIQRMDRIVVLNKGKILEEGDHNLLKKGNGIYAKLWHHQSGGYLDLGNNEV